MRDNYAKTFKGLKELKGKQMKFSSMLKEFEGIEDSTGNYTKCKFQYLDQVSLLSSF